MYGDIRDDWKIADIERKVDRAEQRLYEIDSLRSNVDRLEHSNRELGSQIDGLRSTVENCMQKIEELERINQNF